jgi:hypothetical protein
VNRGFRDCPEFTWLTLCSRQCGLGGLLPQLRQRIYFGFKAGVELGSGEPIATNMLNGFR